MQCSSCSSRDIEFNESAGHAVCVQCGTVLEENTIVSSIEFQESGDRSSIVGQFVSGNCSQSSFGAGPRGRGRYGFSRDSRDATLSNARRVISQVISTLRLPTHYIDKANRLYSLALQKNFLFGRRQIHVVAAVTYTVARQENSPHLLIDFSDVLQVNVYVIGQCFLQLLRLLSLRLPIVDPSLFIHRFAARMDLGTSAGPVALTAMRTITRMKKDWINTGRRPDGVCAAAVLVASRAHGFDRTVMEVAKIFRMSSQTISKRLQDFRLTPSAQLTVEQFQLTDILAEFDPPSFIRGQIENGIEAAGEDEDAFLGDEGMDPYNLLPGDGYSSNVNSSSNQAGGPVQLQLQVGSTAAAGGDEGAAANGVGAETSVVVDVAGVGQSQLREGMQARNQRRQRLYADMYNELAGEAAPSELQSEASEVSRAVLVGAGQHRSYVMSIPPPSENASAPGISQSGTIRRKVTRIPDTAARVTGASHGEEAPEGEEVLGQVDSMEGIDAAEIESFILGPDEQKKRSAIWERMHRGFIDEREARRVQKEQEAGKRGPKKGRQEKQGDGAGPGQGPGHPKRARSNSFAGSEVHAPPPAAVSVIKRNKKSSLGTLKSVLDENGNFVRPSVNLDDARERTEPAAMVSSSAAPPVVSVVRRARSRGAVGLNL